MKVKSVKLERRKSQQKRIRMEGRIKHFFIYPLSDLEKKSKSFQFTKTLKCEVQKS